MNIIDNIHEFIIVIHEYYQYNRYIINIIDDYIHEFKIIYEYYQYIINIDDIL
jgi:hypothetical protein